MNVGVDDPKSLSVVNNAGLCAVLFPFASPWPIYSDVQPTSFLICLWAVIWGFTKIRKNDAFVLIFIASFGALFALYINLNVEYVFRTRVAIVVVPLVLSFLIYSLPKCRPNLIIRLLEIHVALILFQYVDPTLFNSTLGHFIRNSTYNQDVLYRGPHGLNAEPGGASAVITALYFTFTFKVLQFPTEQRKKYYIIALSTIGLLITKSALGILMVFSIWVHFSLFYTRAKEKVMLLTFIIFISITVGLVVDLPSDNFFNKNRGVQLLFSSIESENFYDVAFSDKSLGERIIGLAYGLYSILNYPLGNGGGGYGSAASLVESEYALSKMFHPEVGQVEMTITMTGINLAEFGLFYVIFLVGVIVIFRPRRWTFFIPFGIALAFLTFSFSLSFPITWLLLSICYLERRNVLN